MKKKYLGAKTGGKAAQQRQRAENNGVKISARKKK
jgi:hypothetical protein